MPACLHVFGAPGYEGQGRKAFLGQASSVYARCPAEGQYAGRRICTTGPAKLTSNIFLAAARSSAHPQALILMTPKSCCATKHGGGCRGWTTMGPVPRFTVFCGGRCTQSARAQGKIPARLPTGQDPTVVNVLGKVSYDLYEGSARENRRHRSDVYLPARRAALKSGGAVKGRSWAGSFRPVQTEENSRWCQGKRSGNWRRIFHSKTYVSHPGGNGVLGARSAPKNKHAGSRRRAGPGGVRRRSARMGGPLHLKKTAHARCGDRRGLG